MKKNLTLACTISIILLLVLSTQVNVIASYKQPKENTSNSIDDILFDLKIHTYMKITNMPSLTVCIIKNNSIIWKDSYGYSNYYLRKKSQMNSIYIIGSISKTFIATAIMQIYENKSYNFSLDDDISLYLPYDLKNPYHPDVNITFRMLLDHQSSIDDGFFDFPSYLPLSDDPTSFIKERLIPGEKHYKKEYWRETMPGEKFGYSNWGYILLAALLEQITGETFESYCQKNIFQPLNMKDTSFEIEKLDRKRLARPYYPLIGSLYIPMPNYDIRCAAACGGLRATALDLSNYLMAHMNNGTFNNYSMLNKSTIEIMHTIQNPEFSEKFYIGSMQHGLGWIHLTYKESVWEGYNGGAIGYCCHMMFRQSDHIGIIMMINSHFKRSNSKLVEMKLDMQYTLANIFIQKALEDGLNN